MYVCFPGVGSQDVRGCQAFHDVRYVHIDRAYAVIYFERSCDAQQTLHRLCERGFKSENCGGYINCLAKSVFLSWQYRIFVSRKRLAYVQWLRISLHVIFVLDYFWQSGGDDGYRGWPYNSRSSATFSHIRYARQSRKSHNRVWPYWRNTMSFIPRALSYSYLPKDLSSTRQSAS